LRCWPTFSGIAVYGRLSNICSSYVGTKEEMTKVQSGASVVKVRIPPPPQRRWEASFICTYECAFRSVSRLLIEEEIAQLDCRWGFSVLERLFCLCKALYYWNIADQMGSKDSLSFSPGTWRRDESGTYLRWRGVGGRGGSNRPGEKVTFSRSVLAEAHEAVHTCPAEVSQGECAISTICISVRSPSSILAPLEKIGVSGSHLVMKLCTASAEGYAC